MNQVILEFGESANTIDTLYSDHQIITLSRRDVSSIIKYLGHIKFVVINTTYINGNTVSLIKDIRRYFGGTILVLIAANDAKLAKKFIEAGANDILYLGDVTREKVDRTLEHCIVKQRCKTNLAIIQKMMK